MDGGGHEDGEDTAGGNLEEAGGQRSVVFCFTIRVTVRSAGFREGGAIADI